MRIFLVLLLAACDGGSANPTTTTGGTTTGGTTTGGTTGSTTAGTTGSTTAGTTGGTTGSTTAGTTGSGGTSSAAELAKSLGKDANFLVGLGNDNGGDAYNLGVALDIRYVYLTGGWRTWNMPDGAYVGMQSTAAKQHNMIPMFTTWELPSLPGSYDGDTAAANDTTIMTQFWSDIETLYNQLAAYNDVAIVHFEPDWWGYCEQTAKENPAMMPAKVKINSHCSSLNDDVGGMAQCLIKMGRELAPKVKIGLHYTDWGAWANGVEDGTVAGNWMKALGADQGDLIVTDTVGLDRDCGCWEAGGQNCTGRGSGPFCLDESNTTSPTFHEQLALVKNMHDVVNLPVLWWQMPLGVPSTTPGGTPGHYRDNRVHYMFNHMDEFIAAGGVGAVFGTGASGQTDVTTDGGQFKNAVTKYRMAPAALP